MKSRNKDFINLLKFNVYYDLKIEILLFNKIFLDIKAKISLNV